MKRIYLLIVLLFTAIAAGAQIKVSGGPYLQNVTEDSFTIIWTTTGPAVGWIEELLMTAPISTIQNVQNTMTSAAWEESR